MQAQGKVQTKGLAGSDPITHNRDSKNREILQTCTNTIALSYTKTYLH